MATSGSFDFDFPAIDVISEAWERVGGQVSTANEYTTARRSLDLLFRDLENRGVGLYKIAELTQSVTSGTESYTLPNQVIDIVDCRVRVTSGSTNTDITMAALSRGEYASLPDKTITGQPTQYWVDKQGAGSAKVYVYPTGSTTNTEVIRYWAVTRHQDVGALANDLDVKYSYLPAVVSGLAFFLSLKRPEVDPDMRRLLKSQYEEDIRLAFQADRERVPTRLYPRLGRR